MWCGGKRNRILCTKIGGLLFKVLKRYYNGGSVAGNTLTTEILFCMSPAVYLLVPLAKLQIDSVAYWLLWFDCVNSQIYVERIISTL